MTLEEAHQKAEAAVQTMQAMGLEDAVRGARAIMAVYAVVVVPKPPPAPPVRLAERREAILTMWADGVKGREIAESFGTTVRAVAHVVGRARDAGDPRATRRNSISEESRAIFAANAQKARAAKAAKQEPAS